MIRRILAICLVLVLAFSLVPAAVLAADGPTLTVSSVSVAPGQSGSVTVSISGNTGFDTITFGLVPADGITIDSVSAEGGIISAWYTDYGVDRKVFAGMSGSAATADGLICTINFTVDASATGDLAIQIIEDTNADGALLLEDEAIDGVSLVSGTVSTGSTEPAPTEGYTANVSTTSSEVTVGNNVTVNVGVGHSSDSYYNAAQVVLTYDPTYLELVTDSLGELGYTNANGTLTIQDFGDNKNFGTSCYAVSFKTLKVVDATTVTLTSAKFVDKGDATTSNLIEATKDPASVSIKINEVTYNVTRPTDGNIEGASVATKGQDYTFTAKEEPANYDYTVTVKVGGVEINTVTESNGTYTIPAASVTGDIEITYTRKENSYNVTTNTVLGETTTPVTSTATYGTPYQFTVPADVPAGENVGYTYTLTSVTINGNAYTGYSVAEGTRNYTIPGADITGPIVITISKVEVPANTYTVGKDGTAAGDAAVEASPITQGNTAKITVTKEAGYIYTVTATMGGNTASVDANGNDYTVANVTGNVVFTVNKTLDVSSVEVYEYVQLNGNMMWLVIFDGTLAEGKAPTYDGKVMFWSDKYDAYCYLVIEGTLNKETAAAKVSAQTGTATAVDYGMDINGTGITDAADAQVVWNMYNAQYSDFTAMSMAQFLAADQGSADDKLLDTKDATAIISAILNGTATV